MPHKYSTPPLETPIPHEFSTPPSYTFIPPAYSTLAPETFPLHVIPPLSPTSLALDDTLPSTTSPTPLPSIDETMIDLVPNLCACLPRQPHTSLTRRVVPPLAPSAPSTPSNPFEIAHVPIDHLTVYSRRPKRKTKPPSCETH